MADDALDVNHMNVNPGGKQKIMRDTDFNPFAVAGSWPAIVTFLKKLSPHDTSELALTTHILV